MAIVCASGARGAWGSREREASRLRRDVEVGATFVRVVVAAAGACMVPGRGAARCAGVATEGAGSRRMRWEALGEDGNVELEVP